MLENEIKITSLMLIGIMVAWVSIGVLIGKYQIRKEYNITE